MDRPPPINLTPPGLLGFLGIKNGGRNPQSLGETLAPVWDFSDLYFLQGLRFEDTTSTVNAAGYVIEHQCPENEVHLIHAMSLFVRCGVGESITFTLDWAQFNNLIAVAVTDSRQVGASTDAVVTLPRPIWLSPGESLGYGIANIAGVVDTYSARRFTRFPI